jgi:hypothetical protein
MGGDQTDLFYVTLDGNWAGTATLTDDQGTYTIPISASFNIMSDSITATVVFTNPGDIPTMNTITYEVNGPTDCSVNDNSSDHLSGFEVTTCNVSVPVGQGQAIISGNGAGEDPDPTDKASGNGTVTFSTAHIAPGQVGQASNAGDLIIVGTVTITGSDGTEKGSGTLQISSDQSHISGTAQTTDGTHVTWSVDND